MKVMTVSGTRPEIIRLSLIIEKLDRYCDHVLVHTGQNFDQNLSSIFFSDLGLREPDCYFGVRGESFGEQIGNILVEAEKVILRENPDRILILGDTNSGLASIVAKRMGIPVFHMEAGNRCFDYRVPEEVNRKIIDHCSTVLLPYSYRSKEHLLAEGFSNEVILVIGNPIYEVIEHYLPQIEESTVLDRMEVEPQKYFLATMHRAENVDQEDRLRGIIDGLGSISTRHEVPVVCSLHPRTRDKMEKFRLEAGDGDIRFSVPFGFFDFLALEKNAMCVISDSGTVQEECSILGVPNITIRDVTERLETLECGSNILTSTKPHLILDAVGIVLDGKPEWEPPLGYIERNVSSKVAKIVLSYLREHVK